MMRARALILLAVVSVGSVLAGAYLWLGLPAALIIGGVVGLACALLADSGNGTGTS